MKRLLESEDSEIRRVSKRQKMIIISYCECDDGKTHSPVLTVDKNDQIDESSDEEDLDASAGEYDDEDLESESGKTFSMLTVDQSYQNHSTLNRNDQDQLDIDYSKT